MSIKIFVYFSPHDYEIWFKKLRNFQKQYYGFDFETFSLQKTMRNRFKRDIMPNSVPYQAMHVLA